MQKNKYTVIGGFTDLQEAIKDDTFSMEEGDKE